MDARLNTPRVLTRPAQADIPKRMKYDPCLHIVLYEPEIPQNAGASARTCVAVGAKLWLVRPLGFQVDDRHLRRAGLDYWKHLEWEVVNGWDELTEKLPGQPWLFSKNGRIEYTAVSYQRGDVLVFGPESQGLPASLLDAEPDRTLRIPIREEVRSLNVSNSVAVAAYEALRQWSGLK